MQNCDYRFCVFFLNIEQRFRTAEIKKITEYFTVQVRILVKKIFFSYLGLLVNSKNDLALAQVLNIPDRGLGREAFTTLKHAAREKQLSMFLVWMLTLSGLFITP